jgi:hypothetical protein
MGVLDANLTPALTRPATRTQGHSPLSRATCEACRFASSRPLPFRRSRPLGHGPRWLHRFRLTQCAAARQRGEERTTSGEACSRGEFASHLLEPLAGAHLKSSLGKRPEAPGLQQQVASPHALTIQNPWLVGGMFWLSRNRLVGS